MIALIKPGMDGIIPTGSLLYNGSQNLSRVYKYLTLSYYFINKEILLLKINIL